MMPGFNWEFRLNLWIFHLDKMYWTQVETDNFSWEGGLYPSIVLQSSIFFSFQFLTTNSTTRKELVMEGKDVRNLSLTFVAVFQDIKARQFPREHDSKFGSFAAKNSSWFYDSFLHVTGEGKPYTVASISSSSFLLYTVAMDQENSSLNSRICNLWKVSQVSRQSPNLQWNMLDKKCFILKKEFLPSWSNSFPYYNSIVVNDTFLLIASIASYQQGCYFELWHYSFSDGTWNQSAPDDPTVRVPNKCIRTLASVGPSQVLILILDLSQIQRYELWLYAVKSRSWIYYSQIISNKLLFYLFVWKSNVFLLDREVGGLLYRKLVCPSGYISPDIMQSECIPCVKGYYSTGAGETSCTPCPSGLTTVSSRSTSLSNCSSCFNYCKNGKC
jgi:hypothetical protein